MTLPSKHSSARLILASAVLGLAVVWHVPSRAQPPSTQPAGQFNKGVIIPIKDVITDVTLESLRRRIDQGVADGADLIIFEMDTPGGIVSSATKICDHIKGLEDVYTVAWIKPQALSAGAMISVACNEIVVSGRSKFGDCQPIMIGPGGATAVPQDVRAKMTSPILEEFRDSARRNGYDQLLCDAMIRPELEVFWVENTSTGERRFVERHERDELFGIGETKAPIIIKKHKKVEPKQQPLDLGGQQAVTETVVEHEPGQYVSDAESKTDWRHVKSDPILGPIRQPVISELELLTMSQDQTIVFGFARHKLTSRDQLADHFALAAVPQRLGYNWSEKLVAWLTSPLVRGMLLVITLLAAYVEFNSPGVGLPGIVALIGLVIFLGAPYLTGLADVWDIAAVVVGFVLLGVEIFIIPGFGVAGVAGIVLICVGIVASFVGPEMPDQPPFYWPQLDYTFDAVKTGIWVLVIGMFSTLAGGIWLSRVLHKVPYLGTIVAPNPTAASVAMVDPYSAELARPGQVGVAETTLRPAGKVRFGNVLVDVATEGEFIESDARVEVVERHGNRVVVRRARD